MFPEHAHIFKHGTFLRTKAIPVIGICGSASYNEREPKVHLEFTPRFFEAQMSYYQLPTGDTGIVGQIQSIAKLLGRENQLGEAVTSHVVIPQGDRDLENDMVKAMFQAMADAWVYEYITQYRIY